MLPPDGGCFRANALMASNQAVDSSKVKSLSRRGRRKRPRPWGCVHAPLCHSPGMGIDTGGSGGAQKVTPKGAPSVGHGDMGTPRCPELARPCPATQGATLASGYGHPQHPIPSVPLERWPPWTPRTAPQPPAQPCCHPLGTRRTRGTSRGWCMTWGHALVPGAAPVPAAGHGTVPPGGCRCPPAWICDALPGLGWIFLPLPSFLLLSSPLPMAGRDEAALQHRGPDPELSKRVSAQTPGASPWGPPPLTPSPVSQLLLSPRGLIHAGLWPCSRAGHFSGFS